MKKKAIKNKVAGEPICSNQMSSSKTISVAKQRGMLFTILFLQFCTICANTIVLPFFPSVAKTKGLNNAYIGLVFSSYDISKFIASPIFGSLLIRWPPKSMCAVGNVIAALACIGFGTTIEISDTKWFLSICVITRLTAGIGSAMLTIASTSLLMKATSYRTSNIVAFTEVTIGLGFTIGPVFGAGMYKLTGYAPMFWMLGGVIIAFLPVYLCVVPQIEESLPQNKNFFELLNIGGCLLMLIHCAAVKFSGTFRTTGISDWITSSFHKSPSVVGFLFGVWSLCYTLGGVLCSKVVGKGYIYSPMFGAWTVNIVINLLVGPSELLDCIFHGKKYFWLTVIVMAVSNFAAIGMHLPPFQATLNIAEVNGHQGNSLHTYGMVNGLINCGFSLGSATGPIIAGAITDSLDFAWAATTLVFISIAIIAMLATYLIYMKITSQPLRPPQLVATKIAKPICQNVVTIRKISATCQEILEICEESLAKTASNQQ